MQYYVSLCTQICCRVCQRYLPERAGPIFDEYAFCYLDQFALQVGSRLRNPNRTWASPTLFVRVCRRTRAAGLWEALVAPCTGSRITLCQRVLRWSFFGTLTVVRICPVLVALIDGRETVFAPVRAAQARRGCHGVSLPSRVGLLSVGRASLSLPWGNSPVIMPAGEMRYASAVDICLCFAAMQIVLRKGTVLFSEQLLAE